VVAIVSLLCSKDVEAGPGAVGRGGSVLGKGEVGIEGDPQDLRLTAEWKRLVGE